MVICCLDELHFPLLPSPPLPSPPLSPFPFSPGLLLSLKGHKQTFISFTYSLAPGMDTTSRVDWKVLTTEGVECQHIYFHQLQAGDTVSAIAHKHKRSHTVAVILGNTENTLDLPPEFSVGIGKPKKNAFPMVVISSEDGASLRDFLGRHDPGELHAKIESKGQAHVDRTRASSSTSRGGSHSPDVVPKSKLKSGKRDIVCCEGEITEKLQTDQMRDY